jgi:hypothetical protein
MGINAMQLAHVHLLHWLRHLKMMLIRTLHGLSSLWSGSGRSMNVSTEDFTMLIGRLAIRTNQSLLSEAARVD